MTTWPNPSSSRSCWLGSARCCAGPGLVRNAGIVLGHGAIYDQIWGYDFGPDSKNLAVYISYLRRKLESAGSPPLIRTVRGVGYSIASG